MQHFDVAGRGHNNPPLEAPGMTWMLLWLGATTAAVPAPERYIYEFSLRGTPVGFVELELNGASYRYTSIHVFNREGKPGGMKRTATYVLSPELESETGRQPASLALVLGSRRKGCVDVFNELTPATGELCRERHGESAIAGTLLGKKFWAEFDGAEVPSRIVFESEGSAFTRVERKSPLSPPDFSGAGFAVPKGKGAVTVAPPVTLMEPKLAQWTEKTARGMAAVVHGEELEFCIDYARAYVTRANQQGPVRAVIVHGLRVEGDRAYPHAWVRVETEKGPLELDPTLDVAVTAKTHVPLQYVMGESDQTKAGSIWLSLLAGERRVTRK